MKMSLNFFRQLEMWKNKLKVLIGSILKVEEQSLSTKAGLLSWQVVNLFSFSRKLNVNVSGI